MTNVSTAGQRVAVLRRARGLSQRELATELQRSESWVSQVERGVQPIERLSILQALAKALAVPIADLRPDIPPPDKTPESNDLDGLRLTLAAHPALLTPNDRPTPNVTALSEQVEEAWQYAHSSQFAQLSQLLSSLIPTLELAARTSSNEKAQQLNNLLGQAYQAAAAAFARQDEADAAWVASDRAIQVADASSNTLDVIAGAFRMAHAFIRLNRLDQAERVTSLAIETLRPTTNSSDCPPEALSLLGAMHLVQAIISAKEGERTTAHAALDAARTVANRLGEDRNDFATEFGPTNTELHAVTVAIDLGDAGLAIDLAHDLDVSTLSPERQARFLTDVARAHTQRRRLGEATTLLRQAELLAPEQARSHHLMRETVLELLQLSGHRASNDLRKLAERLNVSPT